MALTKSDLKAIKEIVDEVVDERVNDAVSASENRMIGRMDLMESRLTAKIDNNRILIEGLKAVYFEDRIDVAQKQ